MKTHYRYIVWYEGDMGWGRQKGCCFMKTYRKIININTLDEQLEDKFGYKGVLVTSFQLVGEW